MSCFHCGLEDLQEDDSAWEKHIEYNPKCIYVVQKKGPKYVLDNNKKSKRFCFSAVSVTCSMMFRV